MAIKSSEEKGPDTSGVEVEQARFSIYNSNHLQVNYFTKEQSSSPLPHLPSYPAV